jgi:diguanylate cyclase (GGDEF)-like protein
MAPRLSVEASTFDHDAVDAWAVRFRHRYILTMLLASALAVGIVLLLLTTASHLRADLDDAREMAARQGEALALLEQADTGSPEELAAVVAARSRLEDEIASADDRARRMMVVGLTTAVAAVTVLGGFLVAVFIPISRRVREEGHRLVDARRESSAQAQRQREIARLHEAFDLADTPEAIMSVVRRAFASFVPTRPAQLLLADPGMTTLRDVVSNPNRATPGCRVESVGECLAVRRGRPSTFVSSDEIDACPCLADRPTGPCSATCVPVTFMGEPMGVLHVTGPAGDPVDEDGQELLAALGTQLGIRVGTWRTHEEAHRLATIDSLTGLLNRRAIDERLRELERRGIAYSMAMVDIDNFKSLNDQLGHQAGDRALRLVARVVESALRHDDHIGRWGGDELLVLLPGKGVETATDAIDRARAEMRRVGPLSDLPPVTLSVGVAQAAPDSPGDAVLRAADAALFAAKDAGRDRVMVAPPPPSQPVPALSVRRRPRPLVRPATGTRTAS